MYTVDLKESYFPAQTDTPIEPITLGDMLRRSAKKWPDQGALQEVHLDGSFGRHWTYQQLLDDSLRLAGVLAKRHRQGARVAVWAPNIPEWILMEFGLALSGVTLVTVNPSLQARELAYVLEQSKAEAIYYVEEFRGNPMAKIVQSVCDKLPAIQHRIVLDDMDALFAGDKAPLPEVKPRDPVQIQYTSGTTGFPKGAVLHHFGLVQNAIDTMTRQNGKAGDRMMNYMPLFHTTGCAIITLGVIGIGAEMLLLPMFEPEVSARLIENENLNVIFGVPTMIVALVEEGRKNNYQFESVRGLGSGGAMVPPDLALAATEVFGCNVQIVYGQTESSPVITGCWSDDSLEDSTQTIGQPMPHVEVSIRDPHTNKAVPIGEQGEICTRGYHVMIEYNDNPDATAAALDEDNWLHTGDLGRMNARGYVSITGRVKEMIIRGGENLFPAEIENAILENEAIAEIAVVGVPDKKWGEQVACFMRCNDGKAKPSPAELKGFIRERISPQKTPYYWIWVDEWPLTGSGKIQKFKLADAFVNGEFEVLTV